MTFNPGPIASQSPGDYPAQGQTNDNRIKANINADHVFNDSAAANDGVHRQMTMVDRADPVSLPAGTNFMFYSNNSKGKMYNGTHTFWVQPVLASVVFNNTGAISGSQSLNIASVVRNGAGDFTITFTNNLPSTNGGWAVNTVSSGPLVALSSSITNYTVSSVRILVVAFDGTATDPTLCSVQMFWGGS